MSEYVIILFVISATVMTAIALMSGVVARLIQLAAAILAARRAALRRSTSQSDLPTPEPMSKSALPRLATFLDREALGVVVVAVFAASRLR